MAKFLVLIYGDEARWDALPAEWHEANGARHQALHASAGKQILGANELERSAKAISVRGDAQGNPVVTPGPFAEAKEFAGGYYVLEAADMAEATKLACRLPEATADHGGVEIRGIVGTA